MTVANHSAQQRARLTQISLLALSITLLIVALLVVPLWLSVLTPRWLVRILTTALLWLSAVGYVLAIVLGPACILLTGTCLVRRSRWPRRQVLLRLLSLSLVAILAVPCLELMAAVMLSNQHRPAALPTTLVAGTKDSISIVVIGESTAEGQPYHDWLDVGRILAWKLRELDPRRSIHVQNLATGGICLEQAVLTLTGLEQKPDLLILIAGHNEFQARYGWDRNVRHYVEELPTRPLHEVGLESASRYSALLRLVRQTLDLTRVDLGPPPRVTRSLVDHPVCSRDEYEYLREAFANHLENVLSWCDRMEIIPIVIIPPANEADFPPSRSVLDSRTPLLEREAFAQSVQQAIDLSRSDAPAAERLFAELIAQHDEFAETHYQLGKLLAARGDISGANSHFSAARDRDGLPLRCPPYFEQALRSVSRHHSNAIVVDGPAVFRAITPTQRLDNRLFHDAQHPTLSGYVLLAQESLRQLAARDSLGISGNAESLAIDVSACAHAFEIDETVWSKVADRSAHFFARTAYIRHDPSESLARAHLLHEASRAIADGARPESLGIQGIGLENPVPAHNNDPIGSASP